MYRSVKYSPTSSRKDRVMLKRKVVEFYAHQSGVDLEIAEREVVLTCALQLLHQTGRLEHLAFKGGTCIRKIHLGATGRFSMDLDFTACQQMDLEDVVLALLEVPRRGWG